MNRLLVILFLFGWLYCDETKFVIATGSGSDQESAKQTAMTNALEQIIGVYLDSGSYAKNSAVITDRFYSAAGSYIKNFQILKVEDHPAGKIVTIRAEIKVTDVNRQLGELGLLMHKLDMPRILVVNLQEGNDDYNGLIDKCYMGVTQSLTDGGLFLIDKTEQEAFLREQKHIVYAELNNRIADYGLKINADYIVRFDLKLASDQSSLYVDGEVISPSTGKVIFSADEVAGLESARNDVDRIVLAKNAGKSLGTRILGKIIDNWKFMAENGSYFTLVIEGYSGYNQVLDFQKWLGELKGVIMVSEIESSGQKSTLLIKYSGSRKELKEKIFKLFTQKGWITRLLRSENNRAFIKILN